MFLVKWQKIQGASWSWSYDSCIYNYLFNQCLSPLTLWVRIPYRQCVFNTTCDKVCQWLAAGRWFSPGTPVSSTNKTDCHHITEILLKVALNTITLTLTHRRSISWSFVGMPKEHKTYLGLSRIFSIVNVVGSI